MEGTCDRDVHIDAALDSKPGGQHLCSCQKCKVKNLKHKEEFQNKMIYSQIPGPERVGKLPDAAQRGQVAHHGFNPCFVLQREEIQGKSKQPQVTDRVISFTLHQVTTGSSKKVMESYPEMINSLCSLVLRAGGSKDAFPLFLLQVSSSLEFCAK